MTDRDVVVRGVAEAGSACGIVAQADIAQHAPPREVAEVVREVSR